MGEKTTKQKWQDRMAPLHLAVTADNLAEIKKDSGGNPLGSTGAAVHEKVQDIAATNKREAAIKEAKFYARLPDWIIKLLADQKRGLHINEDDSEEF